MALLRHVSFGACGPSNLLGASVVDAHAPCSCRSAGTVRRRRSRRHAPRSCTTVPRVRRCTGSSTRGGATSPMGWRSPIVEVPGLPRADVITWVPLARRRRAERGYDQARALASALARLLGVPAVRLVRRRVATAPQARRTGQERRSAMRGAFGAVRPAPGTVLLVDDVLTTGATAAACAEVLLSSGARQVHLAAAARSLRALGPATGGTLQRPAGRAYPRVGPRPGLWLPGDVPR